MTSSISNLVLIVLVFLILITLSIMKGWFKVDKFQGILLVYGSAITIIGIVLMKLAPYTVYRANRLLATINPSKDPMGSGYIGVQMRNMLSNAKLIGRGGLGENFYLIPAINTDYILTYLIHRLGWIPFIIVMTIISIFIIRSFILASRQKSILGRLVSTAVLATFTMEVVLYTITNLGLPVMGSLTLPFISYSGMSTIVNMILIGIMLSVCRSGDIVKDTQVGLKKSGGKFLDIVDGKIIIDLNFK